MMAVISHIRMNSKDIVDKIDSLLNQDGFLIIETNNSKRNLEVFEICDKKYEKVEAKAFLRRAHEAAEDRLPGRADLQEGLTAR